MGERVRRAGGRGETMWGGGGGGKIRYWGLSNTPAWYVAKLATLAAVRGAPAPIALQYFYSLVSREVEAEHLPLARHMGLGMMPWSPLAYGLLTGKYDRAAVEAAAPRAGGLPDKAGDNQGRAEDDKRLDGANPFGDSLFTERNWRIVEALKGVAQDLGEPPARVALAWVLSRPGVDTALIDRKSTRLNSSHVVISYAVFCLKKKTNASTHRRHVKMPIAAC